MLITMTRNTLVIVKRYHLNENYNFTSMYDMMHSSDVIDYEGPIKLFTYLYSYSEVIRLFEFLKMAETSKFQLTYLCCNNCNLTEFKSLPHTLRKLMCGNNKINVLPDLPYQLGELFCSENKLTKIPILPPTLVRLNCNQNMIRSLPYLPEGLEIISCANNLIEELPKLPSTLKELNCAHNKLKWLPKLPPSLIILDCSCNEIIFLPKLPNKLELLKCYINKVQKLPKNLPPSLSEINCCNNKLTDLPASIVTSEIKKINILNNPISLEIKDVCCYHYDANIKKIQQFIKKRAVKRISDWYLEIKYNPQYKFCRNRLKDEYEELYN